MTDSMEVELLKQMMVERETRIELLKLKLSFYESRQSQLCSELEQVKEERLNEVIDQQGERIEWQHTHTETVKQLEQLTRDLNQQMASLQKYVTMVQQQHDKNKSSLQQQTDSGFVMQMQAQLCKAMHSQGIADHQLQLVNAHSDAMAKQLRDALIFVEEERSKVELEFMNSLVKMDSETREIESGFKARLAEIHKEIAQLEEDLEEKSKGSDDEENDEEDEEEEDDEETKQAKQELMNMLKEQKDKIAALEKENDKQLRQISSLKRRIDNPDASAEFLSRSEELGMSYDDSESEGDMSEHLEEDHYLAPSASNGSAKLDKHDDASDEHDEADAEPIDDSPLGDEAESNTLDDDAPDEVEVS
jgi:hypothetical protein